MDSSATPFYTNVTNPYNLTLNANQSAVITWWVNATGSPGANNFFVYANITSNFSIGNQTSSLNITIQDITPPAINITYPLNMTYNTNGITELNYTYSDYNSGGSCWYSINAGETNSSVVDAGVNFTNLTSVVLGNTWNLYCNDSSGNLNYSSVTFQKIIPVVGLSMIYPNSNINVAQNEFFNISVNVSCSVNDCGEINVSLDPLYGTGSNYSVYNSSETGGEAFAWEEIVNNGGTVLWNGSSADDSYQTGNLDFNFSFYGTNYTHIYVSSNGRVHFTTSSASSTSVSVPSSSYQMVAPVNRDMYVRSYTKVFYKNEVSPTRAIIEYQNLDYYSGGGSLYLTYEVILYQDGKIKVQYNSSLNPFVSGSYNTGLNFNSGNYLFTGNNAAAQYLGMALTFYPPGYSVISAKGGLISMINGTTPFYTNITNPYNLTLNQGESQVITWWVNSTGTINFPYEFFIYANKTSEMSTGNQTSSWNVTIQDVNSPVINITYPINGTIYNINVSTINYSYSDSEGNGFCWYSINLGGTNSSPVSAGVSLTNVPSVQGSNTWILYCNDSSGNLNYSSVSFEKDIVYPLFSGYWDNNGSLGDSGVGLFNVTVTNTNGTVWLSINNTNITATNLASNIYNVSYNFVSSGRYNYTWWAYSNSTSKLIDSSGIRVYGVNASYPLFSNIVLSPSNGTTYSLGKNYTFYVSIAYTNGTAGIQFNSVNYTLLNNPNIFSKSFSDLAAGTYNYYFWSFGSGTSKLYNRTQTYYYTISKITGVISGKINNSAGNFTADDLSNSNIWINATKVTGFGTGKIYLNGSLINSGVLPLANLTNLSVGFYNITFEYDGNTNYSSARVVLWVNVSFSDVIYPNFVDYLDNNASLNNSGLGLFNVSIGKTNGTVWLEINNTNITASNLVDEVYNASYSFTQNGTYSYRWWAYGSGNSHNLNFSELRYYSVNYQDIWPPTIILYSPVNQTYGNASILVNISSSESGAIWFNVDNSNNSTYSSEVYIDLSDGDHILYVYANDSEDNLNSSSISFYVNTSLPSLIINSPLNTTYNNKTILVDLSSNGDSVIYNWNGTNTSYSSPVYVTFNEGNNSLISYANNSLGLMNSVNVYFSVDTIPPSLEIISPENITYNYTRILVNISSENYSNIWFSWNNSNISYSSPVYVNFNNGSILIEAYANDSVGNTNLTSIIFFSYLDGDNDYIPDYADNLEGNESNVIFSGVDNLNITVGGNSTFGSFEGLQEVIFYDSSSKMINLTYNFSSSEFDLSKVSIVKDSNYIIINLSGQLQSEYNKTIYLENNNFISLCVKDMEVSSISEISSGCSGENETDFTSCLGNDTGVIINGTRCIGENSTISVSNLRHSAIRGNVAQPSAGSTGGSGSSSSRVFKAQCSKDSDCNSTYSCFNSKCVKLFDVKILSFASPADTKAYFNFTYFVKGMADISGDVIINFWLENNNSIVSKGQDVIYLGKFEEKTESTALFLSSNVESGDYRFYVEAQFEGHTTQAFRDLEIVSNKNNLSINPNGQMNIFLKILIIVVSILLILILLMFLIAFVLRVYRRIKLWNYVDDEDIRIIKKNYDVQHNLNTSLENSNTPINPPITRYYPPLKPSLAYPYPGSMGFKKKEPINTPSILDKEKIVLTLIEGVKLGGVTGFVKQNLNINEDEIIKILVSLQKKELVEIVSTFVNGRWVERYAHTDKVKPEMLDDNFRFKKDFGWDFRNPRN